MVGYLEKTYRVKYDAVHDKSIAGMYVNNHHNASLAHDFSPFRFISWYYGPVNWEINFYFC